MSLTSNVRQLENIARVQELRRTLMAQEEASGASFPGAQRPLFGWERDSMVRFTDIHNLMDSTADEVLEILDVITEVVDSELRKGLDGVRTRHEAVSAMAKMRRHQSEVVVKAERVGSQLIVEALEDAYRAGSTMVIQEARRQGIKGLYGREPLDPEKAEFLPGALAAAMQPWNIALHALQMTLLDPNFVPAEEDVSELAIKRRTPKPPRSRRGKKFAAGAKPVQTVLDLTGELSSLVDDSVDRTRLRTQDVAKQETHTAVGKGRNRTAEKMRPVLIYASEILDKATCQKCGKIDGKQYKTMAAARKDYPRGPYKNCLGGNRCRGQLVFIFDVATPAPEFIGV